MSDAGAAENQVMPAPDTGIGSGAVLELTDLQVGYGGSAVCGAVTAALFPGSILGVVGFNGAGKSTVARTAGGQLLPLSGEVRAFGLPVDEDSLLFRRHTAAVFDDDVFFPALSAREHLLLVARGHGVPDVERAVDRELDFFALQERAAAVPDALSSGQRRRLLLAAAFIRPSALLLLDEPEQRLDPVMRERLGRRIRHYADAGGAVFLVTHDPELLLLTADSCLLIAEQVSELAPERAAADIAGR